MHNVDYIKLFQEDEEGDQGKFVECIRDQHLEECTTFVEDIEEAMSVLKSSARNAGKGVSVHEIRQTLTAIAPKKTQKNIDNYIKRGLGGVDSKTENKGIDIDPTAMDSTGMIGFKATENVDLDLFLERLKTGLLHPAATQEEGE